MVAVISAENAILGRLASNVAKRLLKGEEIIVVNAEKSIISGSKQAILREYEHKRERGGLRKGPYFPRMPDQIVCRTIRGMIPYQKPSGRKAYKNLKVYIGIPKELEKKKIETFQTEDIKTVQYMRLADLSRILGAKFSELE